MNKRAIPLLSLIALASLLPGGARAGQAGSQAPATDSNKSAAAKTHVAARSTHSTTGNKTQPYTKNQATPHSQRLEADATRLQGNVNRNASGQPAQPANGPSTVQQQNSAISGQPGQLRPSPPAKSATLPAGSTPVVSAVRPPAASAASPDSDARHRGPNPAVIGGSSKNRARNTASISGNTVHRKP